MDRFEANPDGPEHDVRSDLWEIARDFAAAHPIRTQAVGAAATLLADHPSETGEQFRRTLDANRQQPQVAPPRTRQQWAHLGTNEFLVAGVELLAAVGGGESVPLDVLQTALEATDDRMALLADDATSTAVSAPVDTESECPADDPARDAVRGALLGLSALLLAAMTATALAGAGNLTGSHQHAALIDVCRCGLLAQRRLAIAESLSQSSSAALARPENLAVLGRAALGLQWVDLGRSLLESAERLLPASGAARAEAAIDLAKLDAEARSWDAVAARAIGSMQVLDSERYDQVLRERRLVSTGRADRARELAFRAAIELGDHHLLADLVDATARFGTHLSPRDAAATRPHLTRAATMTGHAEATLMLAPLPGRERPWPSRIRDYLDRPPR